MIAKRLIDYSMYFPLSVFRLLKSSPRSLHGSLWFYLAYLQYVYRTLKLPWLIDKTGYQSCWETDRSKVLVHQNYYYQRKPLCRLTTAFKPSSTFLFVHQQLLPQVRIVLLYRTGLESIISILRDQHHELCPSVETFLMELTGVFCCLRLRNIADRDLPVCSSFQAFVSSYYDKLRHRVYTELIVYYHLGLL